ncbi:MAG: aldolase [Eubacterium sp.]|nr:aldolase [Eubacterium sp.]
MLKLFYITKDPAVAVIAQNAGVDRIFADMEYIGKEKRQPLMDTVKNHHTVEDVRRLRSVIDKAELLVRVNPIHEGSSQEIEAVLDAGADVIMLPMWRSVEEVAAFLRFVNGRAKTLLLLETEEARCCLDSVLALNGIDEIHIGLNDLHLSQGKKNMFELLVDGVVDEIAAKIKERSIPFGIGGVGAVGKKLAIPAENVLAEHYRLGSSMAILARAFCNTELLQDYDEIKRVFEKGLRDIRAYESMLAEQDTVFFERMHGDLSARIHRITEEI